MWLASGNLKQETEGSPVQWQHDQPIVKNYLNQSENTQTGRRCEMQNVQGQGRSSRALTRVNAASWHNLSIRRGMTTSLELFTESV